MWISWNVRPPSRNSQKLSNVVVASRVALVHDGCVRRREGQERQAEEHGELLEGPMVQHAREARLVVQQLRLLALREDLGAARSSAAKRHFTYLAETSSLRVRHTAAGSPAAWLGPAARRAVSVTAVRRECDMI